MTAFIGEDEESAEGYVAAQPGESWLHLTSMNYSGDSIIAGLEEELQRANLERDETDAQRHSEVADGESPLGHRGMIKSLDTPEEWVHQVHPKANHPLWVVGHLGLADNFFLQAAAPNRDATAGGLGRDLLVWDDARR